MAGLWARLRGRRSLAGRLSVTGPADAAIAREDPEPAARPPTPPAQPKLRRDYVASSPQAARERQQRRSDGEFAASTRTRSTSPRCGASRGTASRTNGGGRRRGAACCAAKHQNAPSVDHARRARRSTHVAAALLDVPASERDPGEAQMLRQILVDAPRTCPGSSLFAHDRVRGRS